MKGKPGRPKGVAARRPWSSSQMRALRYTVVHSLGHQALYNLIKGEEPEWTEEQVRARYEKEAKTRAFIARREAKARGETPDGFLNRLLREPFTKPRTAAINRTVARCIEAGSTLIQRFEEEPENDFTG